MKIKTIHDTLPKYMTPGAVGLDLMAKGDYTIMPKSVCLVDTGTVLKAPAGTCIILAPRSSTFKNYGLMLVNSVGIIDQDYCGDNDTLKFAYINMRDEPATIKHGDRIGQAVVVQIQKPELEQVENMDSEDRGGFGTTN